MTRTDRRRFPILLAAIAALAVAMALLFSPVQAQEGSAPDKPTDLSATASHDQVVLTWDDPGDDTITGYVILRRVRENDVGGEFSVLVPDTGSAATTYTDHNVQANTTYTYRIKAINEHGVSERSSWFHIDTPVAPEPTPKASQSKSAYIDAHNARERALEQLLAQTDPSSPGGAANEDSDESKDGKSVGSPQGKAITPRATVNICDRTLEVQAAIIKKTGGSCSTVTDTQLAGIKDLYVLSYSSSTVIADDFAGLTGLFELYLGNSQQLTMVPANAFRHLTNPNFRYMGLGGNRIKTVHPDAFDGLAFSCDYHTATIALNGNVIETLQAGTFEDVTCLKKIDLGYNHIAGFEDGVFAGLTELEHLLLHRNHLKVLPDGLFADLSKLETLDISSGDGPVNGCRKPMMMVS